MSVILWYPQLNVGTLHTRVTYTRTSLAIKDHSHEHSVIPTILKRGYYRPQKNGIPSSLSSIIDVNLIITPPLLGSFHIINLLPLSLRRVHVSDLIFLFRRGSIICSSITFPPCKESPSELHQGCHGNTQTSFEIKAWSVYHQLSH